MTTVLWLVAGGIAGVLMVRALKGRCWAWLPDGPHARTKLVRFDYGLACAYCSSAYQQRDIDKKSLYPLPIVRLWECACGEMWKERATENAKEYAERMADITIAEDERKPIVTPPPKPA